MKNKILFMILGIFLVLGINLISLSSALIVSDVNYDKLVPGGETELRISVKNILENDIKEVSLNLDFSDVDFTSVGSSEDSEEEIEEDDEESFSFRIKAGNDIKPGDYQIPYVISFTDTDGAKKEKKGSIGVSVSGSVKLGFTLDVETPVIGNKGKISLRIVNKGFGDAKFISVKANPLGYTLLSEEEVYIGTISSDDFDTISFDVIFNSKNAKFSAAIDYSDFDNKEISENIELPIRVYTKEKAIELGIIKRNNTLYYIVGIAVMIILWMIYRRVKKRKRMKRVEE